MALHELSAMLEEYGHKVSPFDPLLQVRIVVRLLQWKSPTYTHIMDDKNKLFAEVRDRFECTCVGL